MNETRIRKFKWFWVWQDEIEEAWLREMSQQGLHLKSVGLLGRYLFEQGEPRQFAYFMNFAMWSEKREIFDNDDWERVGQLGNWHYWRKALKPGESYELPAELKRQSYQRVLGLFVIYLPIFIVLMSRADDVIQRYEHWIIEILFGAFYVFFLIYTFAILMMIRRVTTLHAT